MQLYNSLSRKIEEFVPIKDKKVGMYTCGPTVYSYVTIGNWRTYVFGDLLVRAFKYFGYDVDYIMNITDVGHLTGDNLGDADTGDDRLEKAAAKEKKTAWEIAEHYTQDFYAGYEKLGLSKPRVWCKATSHIAEQIAMVHAIETKGLSYVIDDGIYFNTRRYEAIGNRYGVLSTLTAIKEGARVEPNVQKKDKRDFALWKFSPKNEKRQMEWDSPWGIGFPGWHIECSAMSTKYLGDQFDVHVGGEDLKSTHHPNEIAQAEAATGKKPFVNYWLHGAFLTVDGGRMGKSLGNAYTLKDLEDKGFGPLDLRYFYYTGHYRKQLNFTWEGVKAARTALRSLREYIERFKQEDDRTILGSDKLGKVDYYRGKFEEAINNDLNMPEALAVVWEVVKSNVPSMDKYDLLQAFDQVLGLNLATKAFDEVAIPTEVSELVAQRTEVRLKKDYAQSDVLRKKINELGYDVQDSADGSVVKKIMVE
jgi:cysteinyl-tRNA synthetase